MPISLRLGGPRADPAVIDHLRAGEVVVHSPRGILIPARLLIEAIPKRPKTAPGGDGVVKALFGMDTEAAPALAADYLWPDADIRWFHLDSYVAAKVREVVADNGGFDVRVDALADLPVVAGPLATDTAGPYDVIALPFPRTSESLLMIDLIEAAHDALRVGGKFVAATDGNGHALCRALEKVFGKVIPGPPARRGASFFAERRKAAPALKNRAHVLSPEVMPAGAPDGSPPVTMQIETRPGTFSHGSLDRGTRAMLEWYVPRGEKILDLGAGCGAIGIYAALRDPKAKVTLVESNVRAAECAVRNVARNGVNVDAGQAFVPGSSLFPAVNGDASGEDEDDGDETGGRDRGHERRGGRRARDEHHPVGRRPEERLVGDTREAQPRPAAAPAVERRADDGLPPIRGTFSSPEPVAAPVTVRSNVVGTRAGTFDRVLANPPYFGDLRIARAFCVTGFDALRPGGSIALVVRRGPAANAHTEVLTGVFGRVTTFDAGDYAILTAIR
ncbi:MAG: methyltransferase [Planctomycetes bacterium]|nr:methyltransferase [Planctomycetota bacterium]